MGSISNDYRSYTANRTDRRVFGYSPSAKQSGYSTVYGPYDYEWKGQAPRDHNTHVASAIHQFAHEPAPYSHSLGYKFCDDYSQVQKSQLNLGQLQSRETYSREGTWPRHQLAIQPPRPATAAGDLIVDSKIEKVLKEVGIVTGRGRKLAGLVNPNAGERLNQLCEEVDFHVGKVYHSLQQGGAQKKISSHVAALKESLVDLQNEIYWQLLEKTSELFGEFPNKKRQFESNNRQFDMQLKEWLSEVADISKMCADAGICVHHTQELYSISHQFLRMRDEVGRRNGNDLKLQAGTLMEKLRTVIEQATNPMDMMLSTGNALSREIELCERAVTERRTGDFIAHVVKSGRLAGFGQVCAKRHAAGSRNADLTARVEHASHQLEIAIEDFAKNSKGFAASNLVGHETLRAWQNSCSNLLRSYGYLQSIMEGRNSVMHEAEMVIRPPTPPRATPMHLRPSASPMVMSDTEQEVARIMQPHPGGDQRILTAAHGLHEAVRQWQSNENELVAEAKHMALLMAKLSQLIRGEGGNKRQLTECAKAIADSSERLRRLAVSLGRSCPNDRIKNSLYEVADRTRMIGGQLKMLAMIKATMLGAHSAEDDQHSMEQLVLNAQNLMRCVKDTVQCAEAASIKIRATGRASEGFRWTRRTEN